LGREIAQHKDYSEETAQKIDREINDLITINYQKTAELLKDNFPLLNNLAQALLEKKH